MAKRIVLGQDARRALRRGAHTVSMAAGQTLGPTGRIVLMERKWDKSNVVNDGFTINRELRLADSMEDMAVRFLEDASKSVREMCGDGTTTTIVLSEAILTEAEPVLAMGGDPIAICRGIRLGGAAVADRLRTMARPAMSTEDIAAAASVASYDPQIGAMVAELVRQVGQEGALVVRDSPGRGLETEIVEGFQFDQGALSPYFITDSERVEAVLDDPYILLTGQVLEKVEDILPALERIIPVTRTLVIIARDVKGEALAGLAMNKERGNLDVLAVRAPGLGGRQKERLEDLAAATGATVLPDEETGRTLSGIQIDDLGRAGKVVSDRQNTTILDGRSDPERVRQRARRIREEIQNAQTDQFRRELTERLGALLGKLALISVGAPTEAEAKERITRVRKGVTSGQEALRSGLLPGGGASFLRASTALDEIELTGDAAFGAAILRRALARPIRLLARQAGIEPAVVEMRLLTSPDVFTFDGMSGELVSAFESGIVDAAGTTVAVLERAVSVATSLLSVGAAVASPREPGLMGERPDTSARYE